MSQTLTEWSEGEFNTAMKNDGISVVEFGAAWCASCKATEPILAELASTYTGVTFAKIDVAKSPALASRMGVMSLPNIIIMTKGKVVEQIIGGANRAKIEERLKKVNV
jgi:thioredoxin 1